MNDEPSGWVRVHAYKLPELVPNDRECLTVGEDATYFYDVMPMAFRTFDLVMTPKATPIVWDWGWRFPNRAGLVIAFVKWDPGTQDEPSGWIKRLGAETRRAPKRNGWEQVERCAHGVPLGRTVVPCRHCPTGDTIMPCRHCPTDDDTDQR